jgi:regulator of RNase E activity RraA
MGGSLSAEVIERARAILYSPVLCDVMDALGRKEQAFDPFVRPMDDHLVVFGPARTGNYWPVTVPADEENPYLVEMELLDDLRPGDVVVLGCNGPSQRSVPWGELLTTAALARGAAGCVTDGLVRDARKIRETGFPVFHGGIGPWDTRGRSKMMTKDEPILCGGVAVHPGDFIFADHDGVAVIPQALIEPVLSAAFAKVEGENTVRDQIRRGRKLVDIYNEYGIL